MITYVYPTPVDDRSAFLIIKFILGMKDETNNWAIVERVRDLNEPGRGEEQ